MKIRTPLVQTGWPGKHGGFRLAAAALLVALAVGPAGASLRCAGAALRPEWIWHRAGTNSPAASELLFFRKTFRTPPYMWNARLTASADDAAEVFINGHRVASCARWDQPVRAEVSMKLNQGENVMAIRASNREGAGGVLLHLNLGGSEQAQLVTDATWLVSTNEQPGWDTLRFDASGWSPAVNLGPHGVMPWGEVFFRPTATAAESIRVPAGFRVDLLHSAEPEEGSWICLQFDERGRLYVAPQSDTRPVLRFTLGSDRRIERVEPVPAPIRSVMGLLFAHDSLYANAKGPGGTGLYRLTDANHNDQFETNEVRFLKRFEGSGEHGYHALALGPDQQIYILNGNGTKLPEGLSPRSPHRHYAEDVLSLNPDETSRAGGALAPGGCILRTDPEGKDWELFAGGLRNAYDFDFHPDGELFTCDSDNEWDWGTPWYRPIRVIHCVSGAEIGWRDGARAWPDHYADMVSGVVNVGIGSPCGVKFGTRARFPEKYRRALFVQDWSYGRIVAVHLEPRGASYRGRCEEFLRGQPLNLTSMTFGPDGALYFTTGGRGTQSGLYCVSYTNQIDPGDLTTAAARQSLGEAAQARALRRRLEAFHGREDAAALDLVWPHLGDEDRAIRYAARIVLEAQPVSRWRTRVLAETEATAALTGLLALARLGGSEAQADLFKALGRFPLASLDEEHRLLKLRILELSLLRQGRPARELANLVVEKLSPRYPASTWAENQELARLLIYLEAPGIVGRTLDLLETGPTQEQQMHYLAQLRNLRVGWTGEQRRRYFGWWLQPRDHLPRSPSLLGWFTEVGREYVDGASVDSHLAEFREEAQRALPPDQRDSLKALLDQPIAGAQLIPTQPRRFVQEWTIADLLPELDRASNGRDFERGRQAFTDTQCYACHRLGKAGGAVGPELTAVASKYGRRDLLESLLEPSKVISEQYQGVNVLLDDAEVVTGRLMRESDTELVIEIDPIQRTEQTIARRSVKELRRSLVSSMPEGLLHVLTREEIFDLIAFLESGGNAEVPAFRKRSAAAAP